MPSSRQEPRHRPDKRLLVSNTRRLRPGPRDIYGPAGRLVSVAATLKSRNFKLLKDKLGEELLVRALGMGKERINELSSGVGFGDETAHHIETVLQLPGGFFDHVNPQLSDDLARRIKTAVTNPELDEDRDGMADEMGPRDQARITAPVEAKPDEMSAPSAQPEQPGDADTGVESPAAPRPGHVPFELTASARRKPGRRQAPREESSTEITPQESAPNVDVGQDVWPQGQYAIPVAQSNGAHLNASASVAGQAPETAPGGPEAQGSNSAAESGTGRTYTIRRPKAKPAEEPSTVQAGTSAMGDAPEQSAGSDAPVPPDAVGRSLKAASDAEAQSAEAVAAESRSTPEERTVAAKPGRKAAGRKSASKASPKAAKEAPSAAAGAATRPAAAAKAEAATDAATGGRKKRRPPSQMPTKPADVIDVRRMNLDLLTRAKGGRMALAWLTGLSAANISHRLYRVRAIDDEDVQRFTKVLGLPDGWLDTLRTEKEVPQATWDRIYKAMAEVTRAKQQGVDVTAGKAPRARKATKAAETAAGDAPAAAAPAASAEAETAAKAPAKRGRPRRATGSQAPTPAPAPRAAAPAAVPRMHAVPARAPAAPRPAASRRADELVAQEPMAQPQSSVRSVTADLGPVSNIVQALVQTIAIKAREGKLDDTAALKFLGSIAAL